jgi:hypothetical protein
MSKFITKEFNKEYFEIIVDYNTHNAKIKCLDEPENNFKTFTFVNLFIGKNKNDLDNPHGFALLFTHANDYYTFIGRKIMHFCNKNKIVEFISDKTAYSVFSYAIDAMNRAILFDTDIILDYDTPLIYDKFYDICNLTESKSNEYGNARFKNFPDDEFDFCIYPGMKPEEYLARSLNKRNNLGPMEIKYKNEWIEMTYDKWINICNELFSSHNMQRLQSTNKIGDMLSPKPLA